MSWVKESDAEKELEKEELLAESEISLILDSYDDIFSDFDPRPFAHRALSDDFLLEAKRAARDKQGSLELRFLIPKNERKLDAETIIKGRLREHFKRHYDLLKIEVAQTRKKGWLMALVGIICIIFASYLLSLDMDTFLIHLLIVILEPAGWFTAWTGLDEIYYTVNQKKPDMDFYQKMMHSGIIFVSY